MPCGLSSSPWVSATATIIHLHPVSITGYSNGSFGFSASLSRRAFVMWSPSGSSLSQSSFGVKALLPPSWCLVGVFAMRPPCGVEFVSDLIRNVDSSRTFPRCAGLVPSLRDGVTRLGSCGVFLRTRSK